MVYMAFRGPIRHEIDHINGVRDDNRLWNLRDVTKQVNVQAAADRNGGKPEIRGALHPRAVLNEVQVRILRAQRRLGFKCTSMLARELGVSGSTAKLAAKGVTWKHIATGGGWPVAAVLACEVESAAAKGQRG